MAGIILVSGSLASLLAIPALSWTIRTGGDFQTVNLLAMTLGICSLYLPVFCYRRERRQTAPVMDRMDPGAGTRDTAVATACP